jgi:hypothetical protein
LLVQAEPVVVEMEKQAEAVTQEPLIPVAAVVVAVIQVLQKMAEMADQV